MAMALSLLLMLATPGISNAAEAAVGLGTAYSYAILAGSTITNTGSTTIVGDVGVSPGNTLTGFGTVTLTGAQHLADPAAVTAKSDLVTAYNDAAGRIPTIIGTELGGQTLDPGVYTAASGTFGLTGTLTLDAHGDPEAVFIFQTSTTLITAPNSVVNPVNGARFCRIFWKVGSSATLDTNTHFVGHILALTSITANTGATIQGQLLARNGAVTLDRNTIINGPCDTPGYVYTPTNPDQYLPPTNWPPIINVIKTPDHLALPAPGLVTYTYTVSNPGMVELSPVTINDDSISEITYASGDINNDNMLQPDETWIYTGSADLAETTKNTVTVSGFANGVYATDIAYATVVVVPGVVPTVEVYPPLINLVKIPSPLALTAGPGWVTYTYKVENPGEVALSDLNITDDKVSSLKYSSGDLNGDNLLQPDEIWIYTGSGYLDATTKNTATVEGIANNMTATDVAFATVVVTQPVDTQVETPVNTPVGVVTGPETPVIPSNLPRTGAGNLPYLLTGLVMLGAGLAGGRFRK